MCVSYGGIRYIAKSVSLFFSDGGDSERTLSTLSVYTLTRTKMIIAHCIYFIMEYDYYLSEDNIEMCLWNGVATI